MNLNRDKIYNDHTVKYELYFSLKRLYDLINVSDIIASQIYKFETELAASIINEVFIDNSLSTNFKGISKSISASTDE